MAVLKKDRGKFLSRDQCGDQCESRTHHIELVNDIDHVTGFTDKDLARFSVGGVRE